MSGPSASAVLACHPVTPAVAVRGIAVEATRSAGVLSFAYRLRGDLGRLRIPEPVTPRAVNGLWQRTCFESFVALDGAEAYYEFNFSPSGEWAVFAFHKYREGSMIEESGPVPIIAVRRAAHSLELNATIALDGFFSEYARAPLRLALSAVIEDSDGNFSYWALHHPTARPDFHHIDGFVLKLG